MTGDNVEIGSPINDRGRGFKLVEHIGLLASIILAFIVAFRLLAISQFSPITAGVVLTERGTTDVLIGTLIPSMSMILNFVAISILAVATFAEHQVRQRYVYAAVAMSILAALTAPLLLALLILAGPVAAFIFMPRLRSYLRQRREQPIEQLRKELERTEAGKESLAEVEKARARLQKSKTRRASIVALYAFFALYALLLLTILVNLFPWMAVERVEISEREPIVAYVLRDANDRIILMRHSDRRVLIFNSEEVDSRQVCEPNDRRGNALTGRPLLSYLGGLRAAPPEYPPCD